MNEVMNNKVIVIGGDHHNTLWVIRSLGQAGIRPFVIVVSQKKSCVTKSRYIENSWIVPDEKDVLRILQHHFLNEKERPVIISTADACADLLDCNYSWLSQRYILPNIDHQEGKISHWMDKNVMVSAAKEAGFYVPKTWSIELKQAINLYELIPGDITYPCILKPQKSSKGTKFDFRICKDEKELINHLSELRFHLSCVLIQEYLKPDHEIAIIGVRLPFSGKNIIPGLLDKLGTCGSLHNMGMPTYNWVKPQLSPWIDIAVIERFFKIINYCGIYSIEYFIHNQKAYFLEINLRTDGDMFVYTSGGVNLPLLWVMDVTGQDISSLSQCIDRDVYGMLEIVYIKYFKWRYFFNGIKDWWRSDCYAIFSWKDLKPFFFKFIYYLRD